MLEAKKGLIEKLNQLSVLFEMLEESSGYKEIYNNIIHDFERQVGYLIKDTELLLEYGDIRVEPEEIEYFNSLNYVITFIEMNMRMQGDDSDEIQIEDGYIIEYEEFEERLAVSTDDYVIYNLYDYDTKEDFGLMTEQEVKLFIKNKYKKDVLNAET